MLPYKMRNTNDNNANPLQCGRCEDWIGQYSMPLNRMPWFFTHCEICKDTLCEFCSEEYIRKPTTRVQKMVADPLIFKDWYHWANMLNRSLFKSDKQWMLDLYQIVDVH